MKKYALALLTFAVALTIAPASFSFNQKDQHLSAEQLNYLEKVYPLANKDQFNHEFFDSLDFYWYDPLATASFFKKVATDIKPGADPHFVCLSWIAPCKPQGAINGVVRNQYPLSQMTPTLVGTPSNHLVEVYHNGWYQEPGLYFYALKGTGTFLNVGHTLIARNKVDALHQMGLSDSQILKILTYYIVDSQYLPTFDYIAQYADTHHISFDQALTLLMSQSRDGTNYLADRFNATASCDYALYELARKKGYDTVQFTNQANINGDWGYEIVDVRAENDDSLTNRWIKERKYLFVADPFNTNIIQPCQLRVPFKMVRCENTPQIK
jgi:hypothetical protein